MKADIKVANMPVVRVLAKPQRHDNKQLYIPPSKNAQGQFHSRKGSSSLSVTQPVKSRINYQALTSKAQKNLAQNVNQPVDIRKFQPGALCKFDPPSAHHKFDKDSSALRSMYKHIFKDQRHNSLTFDGHGTIMESYLDMSEMSS